MIDWSEGDRVVFIKQRFYAGPRYGDIGTVLQVGCDHMSKIQFDRAFQAPLGKGVWWCTPTDLERTMDSEPDVMSINLEEVL